MNAEQQKFYDECSNSGKFNDEQMRQIRWGFKNGLTSEQVAIFANPQFNWGQMAQIRCGFEDGLTPEQITTFADLKFGWDQMKEIRWGFEYGLTPEQITTYADTKFNADQMAQICWGFVDGLTPDQIATYADVKFEWEQMQSIRNLLINCNEKVEIKPIIVAHATICKELGDTYAAKNADYGSSFSRVYERFGLKSAVIRLSDKLYRLEALCDKEAAVPNESVRDTLMDMANYCIMAVMELDKDNVDGQGY